MSKKIILWALLIFISACNKSKPNTAKEDERFFLVSHAGAGDLFWNIVFAGAKQAAADIDLNLKIVAPETPNDIAREVELLNAAIASKPRGIILSVADDKAFSNSLKEAKAQNIPVIVVNSRPSDGSSELNPYLAFVGMDDYQAGIGVAKKAIGLGVLKDRAVVAIHQAGHSGLEQRATGIKDTLTPLGLVVDKLDISSDAAQALQVMKGYLSKNKDCSAVFFVGAFGVHAVGRWLRQEHKDIFMASFDLTPLTIELLKNQALAYSVDQQPFMQGYMSVTQMSLHARYQLHPADLNTGLGLVDQQQALNLDQLVSMGVR